MLPYNKDAIIAIATPPGIGALAVVRISGTDLKNLYKDFTHQFPKNNSNLLEISYISNTNSDTVYAYVPDGKTFKNIPSVYYRKYLDAFSDSLFLSVNDDSLKTVLK